MLAVHEFLVTFDDSNAYQTRDYRRFSQDTKTLIAECN